MLLLGARVGYAFPLSLTVYSGCYVFIWLTVEIEGVLHPYLISEDRLKDNAIENIDIYYIKWYYS